jgi:hypothetical protein
MHCQCLLANDLIQYSYRNASGRNFCLSNRLCRSSEREMTVKLFR